MSYCPLLQSKVVPLIQKLMKIVYMFPILCKKNKCYVVTTFKFSTSHKILDFLQGSNINKLFKKICSNYLFFPLLLLKRVPFSPVREVYM